MKFDFYFVMKWKLLYSNIIVSCLYIAERCMGWIGYLWLSSV